MTYKVKSGDTLTKIAKRNKLTLAQLLQANPQIKDPNKIKVGQAINIPNGASTTAGTTPAPATPAPAKPAPAKPAPAPPVTTAKPVPKPTPATTAAAGALGAAIAAELGSLSAKYETGGRGPGTVSSGAGDPGGVSYGSYQMATKMGVPAKFVSQTGFPWLQDFYKLVAGTKDFTACWKRIAAAQTDAFQQAQHAYALRSAV
jgi:murein DD-endopeptidase MepM/ murein hydrolase activator NlpD